MELEENIRILIKLNETYTRGNNETLSILTNKNREVSNLKRKSRKKKYETSDDENDSNC